MKLKLTFDKGLNADALSSELGDGFFSSCSNTRTRKGFTEMVGGKWDTGIDFTGTRGSLLQLYGTSASYLVHAGASAVEAYSSLDASVTAITRQTEGRVISNATAAGTTVTITTATNHGRSTGNVISVWGFTPSTYNAESVAITVTSATTFTYTAASAPAVSPATAFGMYSLASNSHIDFAPGGELNGILLLNSTSNGCYYWGGDTSIPVRKVVGSYAARASVPFKNYIVQLAPTISSVEYPFRICWSTAAEPGTVPHNGFTAAATNEAGDVDKPEIGEMVFALPLGDDLIVYGTKGRLLMRYIGGNDVFAFTQLPGTEGLYNSSSVVDTPVGHVFVDRDRHVRVHSGGVTRDISHGRVQSILGAYGRRAAGVILHPRQSEVWIGYRTYPASAGVNVSSYLIWNWEEDTWGSATPGDMSGIAFRTPDKDNNINLYMVDINAKLYLVDDANYTTSATSYVIREGIDAGDNDVVKNLQRSRWNIETKGGITSTFTVEHGSSMFADTDATYAAAVAYTVGTTDYVNSRPTGGKYMAVKLNMTAVTSGSALQEHYGPRVRTADLDFTAGGRR